MKQIRFIDKENSAIHGVILTDEGDIICGCCGCLIPKEEIDKQHEILNIYDLWLNLDEEILGDDYGKEF